VLAGEFSANETQASYDEAVYRALLHFRGEMSDGLRQYLLAQLARSKAEWCPTSRWNHCGARTPAGAPAKAGVGKVREPQVCPDCHMAHAGDCW